MVKEEGRDPGRDPSNSFTSSRRLANAFNFSNVSEGTIVMIVSVLEVEEERVERGEERWRDRDMQRVVLV